MVQSKINQAIEYSESHKLDETEFGHDSALYSLPIYDENYIVAIGKLLTKYIESYNVAYFPIYLVSPKDKIKAKIGVFEIESNKALSVMEDGDMDLDKLGEPLIFRNVSKSFMKQYGKVDDHTDLDESDVTDIQYPEKDSEAEAPPSNLNKLDDDSYDEEDEIDMFSLQTKSDIADKTTETTLSSTLKDTDSEYLSFDDLFIKETMPSQISYPTETEEDAKRLVREYKDRTMSPNDNWIQIAFKNKEFEILRNEGGGDCFFAVLRDAYSQIGYTTTVAKLRTFLSQEVDQTMFEQYETLYKNYKHEIDVVEAEMNKCKKSMSALKKQSTKKSNSKEVTTSIIEEAKTIEKEYKDLKVKLDLTKELSQEVEFMKFVETIPQFQHYIQTSDYWADNWAVVTLIRLLNINIIILKSSEDENQILQCTEKLEERYSHYDPQYYIIVSKSENHYELVSYRKKKLLTFADIPFAIKFKVMEKCMEKNAGIYFDIPAFKQFKAEHKIETKPDFNKDSISQEEEGLYDSNVVFMYYKKSANEKPGHGSGEQIAAQHKTKNKERELDFAKLRKIEDWRKKLSDPWTKSLFTIDTYKWASVSHYLLALPFQDSYKEIFQEFSLNSNSVISKNIDKAMESIEKKKKNEVGKHYEVYSTLEPIPEEELREYRKKALRAKFTQNADFTTLLCETKDAKLTIYQYRNPAEVDIDLMKLRQEIMNAKTDP
jgi:hypothetical protein